MENKENNSADPRSAIYEIVINYMHQLQFSSENIDYQLFEKHKNSVDALAELSNSSIQIFDLNQTKIIFFSKNYGKILGYSAEEFQTLNYAFFEAKIHPEDKYDLAIFGLSTLKLFKEFSSDEKLNHKVVYEFRMQNAQGIFVRMIDQYQILELDSTGQIWLMMSTFDISPNQDAESTVKCQIHNFRTGKILNSTIEYKPSLELTKRELEILNLVKKGYLSKEISDKLFISVHTVNTHRQRLLEKLGANNSMEAIIFATKYGLIQ
jgi:DNA-binding CsgD family transcriptional regulator/PAS domain-containing protein